MNALTRKLKKKKKNVINEHPDPEETYLGIDNKQELELLKMAYNIVKDQDQRLKTLETKQTVNPTVDYTDEKNAFLALNDTFEPIVSRASRIVFLRALHIFETAIASQYHLNDPLGKMLFYTRFFWFLDEIRDLIYHRVLEFKIMGESDFFDLCEGVQDEKLKVCNDFGREYFSKESFTQWLKNHPNTSSNLKSHKELNDTEEEYLTFMETERRAKERNERYLKEKCPTCPNKCKWYTEQTHNL
jgi:hypothetical protein